MIDHRAERRSPNTQTELPLVYVILLTWNSLSHLDYCLPTVVATDYTNCRLLLVDNGSSDGSPDFVSERFPEVTLIRTGKNLGFAAGNNIGIRHALRHGADYIVLLNPDTRVDPRWISEAVGIMTDRPLVGLLGFRVFGEFGREDEDGKEFESASAAWCRADVQPAHFIAGCALFCRAAMFHDIGLFDEMFFAYGEEDDLERRATKAGYEMVRINVPVWHYSMASWGRLPLRASWLAMRNTLRCAIKNDDWRSVLRTCLLVSSVACNPFSAADSSYSHYRRLRPSNAVVNGVLLTGAILWNLFLLPQTIAARKSRW